MHVPKFSKVETLFTRGSSNLEKLAQKCADDFYGLDFFGLGHSKEERIRLARRVLPVLSDLERRAKAAGVKEGLEKALSLASIHYADGRPSLEVKDQIRAMIESGEGES